MVVGGVLEVGWCLAVLSLDLGFISPEFIFFGGLTGFTVRQQATVLLLGSTLPEFIFPVGRSDSARRRDSFSPAVFFSVQSAFSVRLSI